MHKFPPLAPAEPQRAVFRSRSLPLPSLPWGEFLIIAAFGLMLIQL